MTLVEAQTARCVAWIPQLHAVLAEQLARLDRTRECDALRALGAVLRHAPPRPVDAAPLPDIFARINSQLLAPDGTCTGAWWPSDTCAGKDVSTAALEFLFAAEAHLRARGEAALLLRWPFRMPN